MGSDEDHHGYEEHHDDPYQNAHEEYQGDDFQSTYSPVPVPRSGGNGGGDEDYPDLDEGSLSRLRSKLVSKEGLATLAERFELGPLVLLGAGERKSGGRHRASIMADTVEALAGGMLVEAGFGMASEIVASWFVADVASLDIHTTRDAKTRLQEWLQGKGYPLPAYEVIAIFGDDHNQIFEVACSCKAAESTQVGTASSRKKAEQKAAEAMLEILENE